MAGDEERQDESERQSDRRDGELSRLKSVREEAVAICQAAQKAFDAQKDRAEAAKDHWDAFNCVLGERQYYHGTSEICTPFVKDAVQARQTRFSGQLFPENLKHIEAIGDGAVPFATIGLLEHYIRRAKLKTHVIDPLIVNGDVEGQYNVFISWDERIRHVTSKVMKPVEDDDGYETGDSVEDMASEEELKDFGPSFEVLSDSDVAVFPETAASIEQAIEAGGGAAIIRRWTKGEIKRLRDKGDIDAAAAKKILETMSSAEKGKGARDTQRDKARAAGIRLSRGNATCHVLDIWCKLKVRGKKRICRVLWAGEDVYLTIKRNPYWCDRVPLLSCPAERASGLFKGNPPLASVIDLHVLANDTVNEMADSSHFSMLPIIMTDPQRNPRIASMVLAPAAVWETDPQGTQFAQFPDLWRTGIDRVLSIREQIFQTLSVNPAMIPGTTGKNRKMNQAEIAQEQMVDILTTADAVTVLEEGILTPLLTFMIELDHQFRDKEITVRGFGPVGRKIEMEVIEPIQIDRKTTFRWLGSEAAKNAARMQQKIAFLNVMRSLPPQAYPGYKLNLAPVIEQQVEELFGPVLAPQVFTAEEAMTVDPAMEDEMMEHGFDVAVHPMDNDQQHLASHMAALQRSGDPHGTIGKHILKHQQQVTAKAMQQTGQQQSQGGGGPRSGGQPRMPQSQPGAPGQIHPDQMARAGAITMPRKE